jgi:putrescine aminotransferase
MRAAAGTEGREATLRRYREHVSSGRARLAQMMSAGMEVRSQGCLVYDEDGEAHLDCGGYGVFLLGHCHPDVVAAVREQLERNPLATRQLLDPCVAAASERLSSVSPAELEYVLFTGGGAEAVEAGLKIARLNGASNVISTRGGFHGKTMGALSVTGRDAYREPFDPLVPGVRHVRFGDAAAVQQALAAHEAGSCTVILEPIQAEGGVVIPPPGYLREVRAACDRHSAMLILDEIQTGLGRVGAWWGADLEGVVPDILLTGKALSGGVIPVGAVVCTPKAFERLGRDPVLHTTTFSGAPVAAAAANAALEVIERDDVVERSASLGAELLGEVRRVLSSHPRLITDVRGVGLLIGIEFAADHYAADFAFELLTRRVIVSASLNANRVMRLTPPVMLSEQQVDWLLSALDESAAVLADRYREDGAQSQAAA